MELLAPVADVVISPVRDVPAPVVPAVNATLRISLPVPMAPVVMLPVPALMDTVSSDVPRMATTATLPLVELTTRLLPSLSLMVAVLKEMSSAEDVKVVVEPLARISFWPAAAAV